MRNLIYQFDHGAAFPEPKKIHAHDDLFARASDFGLTHRDIAAEEHAFVIMRHPTARFLSLYFDKVIGNGSGGFNRLHRQLPNSAILIQTQIASWGISKTVSHWPTY